MPPRELLTTVTFQPIDILKPVPIPALESFNARQIVREAKELAWYNDPARYTIWATVELFLEGSDGLRDSEISHENSKLFFSL